MLGFGGEVNHPDLFICFSFVSFFYPSPCGHLPFLRITFIRQQFKEIAECEREGIGVYFYVCQSLFLQVVLVLVDNSWNVIV